jgi:hypothetical protein
VTPFSKTASGTIVAGFSAVEADIIGDLAAQIAGMLVDLAGSRDVDPLFDSVGIGGSAALHDDPAIARLLPDAYGDDADASRDFRQLTERGLARRKVTNAGIVIASLESGAGDVELNEQQSQAWLRTLSDIRLTIAARLGIEGDGDEGAAEGDAAESLRELYDWLAFVTESLIDALEQ